MQVRKKSAEGMDPRADKPVIRRQGYLVPQLFSAAEPTRKKEGQLP
jgi:hypothetical protein